MQACRFRAMHCNTLQTVKGPQVVCFASMPTLSPAFLSVASHPCGRALKISKACGTAELAFNAPRRTTSNLQVARLTEKYLSVLPRQ